MARTNSLNNYLTDIATAIKTKKNDETPINASKFDEEIVNLPSGDGDLSEYFAETPGSTQYIARSLVKKFPPIKITYSVDLYGAFQDFSRLIEVPDIINPIITNMKNCFSGCKSLTEIILNWDTTRTTNMMSAFQNCSKLKKVDISNCDTSKVTTFLYLFSGCKALEEITAINASMCTTPMSAFSNCNGLKTFGGFINLGKAYSTAASANQASCQLDFNSCTLLTHDSLMNIINGLYDIGSLGVQTQNLRLGTTNKNKLTAEEIAIATGRGWSVS